MSDKIRSLVRFFITLPEPFPVPDGYVYHGAPVVPGPYDVETMGHLFVHLRFLQSRNTSRRHGSFSSAAESTRRFTQSEEWDTEHSAPTLEGDYTTVVATTLGDDENREEGEQTSPQHISIEHDALNRCIYAIREVVRTYRAAFGVTCALPSYELLDISLPYQVAQAAVITQDEDGVSLDNSDWGPVSLLLLNHANVLDLTQGPELNAARKHRLDYFNELMNSGNPLFIWCERFVEARRALTVEGQYGTAVTLSNTASEVLLDSLLATLMWESGKDPREVANIFAEGRLARRVKSHFAELLGGDWALDGNGPVADWFHKCYRLRHRVVHGGYAPSHLESQIALTSVHQLSMYCWDRLAAKRKKFPRTALMMLAEEGLQRRGKWCSFMKHFSSTIAPREESWLRQSQEWREEVQALLMSNE